MQVISVNLGEKKEVKWRGKKIKTGIFKTPVNQPIKITKTGVKKDHIDNLIDHGGVDKAVYLFSSNNYPYWRGLYPGLTWEYGMFGENLTIKNCDEASINIGDVYAVGTAIIQVSQPRQPCFKLGIRFGTQNVIKQFVHQPYSGIYCRVLKEGEVSVNDELICIEKKESGVPITAVFGMLYNKIEHPFLMNLALNDPLLAESCKKDLRLKIKNQETPS